MIFRCRDLDLNVFEIEVDTVEDAILEIEKYEKEHQTALRCFEKETGKRIVGGNLINTKND